MQAIYTPADLKAAVESRGTESYFFTRRNMKFAGDTMRNFGVCRAYIATNYDADDNYLPGEGVVVEVWELYRKRPVKAGNQGSFYFDATTFKKRHGKPLPYPKFKPGDLVEWTNSYGVYWGIRKIVSMEYRTNRPCYYMTPTDTPWFAVGEEDFELVKPNKPRSVITQYGRLYKTHAFEDADTANAFMLQYDGWGLLGLFEDGHGRRWHHVARMDDKGKPVKRA